MKKSATILLLLFMLVQAWPIMNTIWDTDIVLVSDLAEEKEIEKADSKLKKDFLTNTLLKPADSCSINTQIQLSEFILPPPCFDKLTPPPNFS